MIHSFSVSNYYSIRDETTLDLRIPRTAPDLPRFRESKVKPGVRLPSVAVFIGPNGSGKTTLLRALTVLIGIACESFREQSLKALTPFFSGTTRNDPTCFCLEFEADWLAPGEAFSLFRYQLDAHNQEIASESLLHFPNGRPRRLFERRTPQGAIYVAPEFDLKPGDDRLKAVRKDASVISTLAFLNVPLATSIANILRHWLYSSNILFHGNWTLPTDTVMNKLEQNPGIQEWLQQALLRSDLAIQGLRFKENAGGQREVVFDHHGLDEAVPLLFESGGTQRMFHLFPQLHAALAHGFPAIIDEIEGYLHVDIVSEILQWFRSEETNPRNAQLFVTSHNVGLLDELENEELFIVEKNNQGETGVYGAQDIRGLRRDTRLYPKYRAGVLGGLPKIG